MNGNGTEEYGTQQTEDLTGLGCLAVFISLIVAMGFVIWQIYNWAKTGAWIHLPLSTAFRHFGYELDSIYNPQSWIGIAKIA